LLTCPFVNAEPVTREQLGEETLLKEETATAPVANGVSQDSSHPDSLQPAHGYSSFPAIAPTVHNNHPDAHIHPDLRSPSRYMATANMMSAVAPQPPAGPPPPGAMPGPSNSPPAAPGAQLLPGPPPHDSGELTPDGRKAKRELSQSKRAAQNRAAQVSFTAPQMIMLIPNRCLGTPCPLAEVVRLNAESSTLAEID
jgi:hypothetical protein